MRGIALILLATFPGALLACSGDQPDRSPDAGAASPDVPYRPPESGAIPLAITVDDLSRHGPEIPGVSRIEIARALSGALVRHGVPQVYGFVNGYRVERARDQDVLAAWMDAGYPLGNHTYTHIDLRQVTVDDFLRDIEAGEPVLEAAMGEARRSEWHTFRFPFSVEGQDLPSRARIREYLAGRGYRIAPLTIDFFDWAFQGAYAQCLKRQDEAGLMELRRRFLAALEHAFDWSVHTSDALFGRQINHILLMHIGGYDAVMIEEMLAFFEMRGVRFISLDEALADPLYSTALAMPNTWGGSFLQQAKSLHPELQLPSSPGITELRDLCP